MREAFLREEELSDVSAREGGASLLSTCLLLNVAPLLAWSLTRLFSQQTRTHYASIFDLIAAPGRS